MIETIDEFLDACETKLEGIKLQCSKPTCNARILKNLFDAGLDFYQNLLDLIEMGIDDPSVNWTTISKLCVTKWHWFDFLQALEMYLDDRIRND